MTSLAGESAGGMEFVALRTRLRPGAHVAYEHAHATVWPEVQAVQRAAGIRRWLIYRRGLDLLHVVQCADFERAQAQLAGDSVDRRWQAEMARYVVQRPDGRGSEAERLTLIYHGDNEPRR